ncbi:MAG: S8 family serine peptidase [Clostridium sp.]
MQKLKTKSRIIIMISTAFLLLLFIYGGNHKTELVTELEEKSISNKQWALLNKAQMIEGVNGIENYDINAVSAWEISKGDSDIIVGVLDTGIDISNPMISESIFVNRYEIANNDLDDDNNGFVDDVNGWDFYNNDNSVYDDYLGDYHGTFITSLIVGAHKKSNEVWGIAPNVKILPLKFMRGSSGNLDDAIKALDYAYSLGVRIINCSWDNTTYDYNLYEVMRKYDDILFVCSSGNAGNDLKKTPAYPCNFDLDNVLCVAAVDNKGEMYEFSGYGTSNLVAAPGKDVLGMLPEGDYLYSDGTSFATAYVTGIAALVKSTYKDISSEDLAKIIRTSQRSIYDNTNSKMENKIVDAKLAIEKVLNLD